MQQGLKALDERLGVSKFLILTVTENGFGKRTDIDEYRLTARAAQGVTNLKATPKVGKSMSILLVDETSELMAHQPVRQDHPHRHQNHPRRRPRHPGREAAQPRIRRQGSRRRHHPARGAERQGRGAGDAVAVCVCRMRSEPTPAFGTICRPVTIYGKPPTKNGPRLKASTSPRRVCAHCDTPRSQKRDLGHPAVSWIRGFPVPKSWIWGTHFRLRMWATRRSVGRNVNLIRL
jgi:hypothetical protein